MCAPEFTGVATLGGDAEQRRAAWAEGQVCEKNDAMAKSSIQGDQLLSQFSFAMALSDDLDDVGPMPILGAEVRGANRSEFGDRICSQKGNGIELVSRSNFVAVSCRLGADYQVRIQLTVLFDEHRNEQPETDDQEVTVVDRSPDSSNRSPGSEMAEGL